jgi:hypothetical protein
MQAGLAVKDLAKEAWEAIHSMQVGADKVNEANAERLRLEFADILFKSSECVEEFALRISGLATQLRSQGDDPPDKKVMKKMLQSVLERLLEVAMTMETLLHLDSLSIEEVVRNLQAVENHKKEEVYGGQEGCWRATAPHRGTMEGSLQVFFG